MTLTIEGYELLVLRATCEACQAKMFIPIDQWDEWVDCHYLPGANLALVRSATGAESWIVIHTVWERQHR